ncbi:MAG: multidrug effflux MFS transporter [Pseudomonadota bacterium]
MIENRQSAPIWLLFLLVSFPQISETIYSPALPNIAYLLQTNNHLVQRTLSIYFIGFALGVLAWGRWSENWGRRTMMITGILFYSLTSLLCLIASGIGWLLFFRLLQGFAASCGSILPRTIALESLTDSERKQYFSTVGFVLALSIALGPFLGGYLTQWFNWRANFALLVIIGISLLLLAYTCLPETLVKTTEKKPGLRPIFLLLIKDKYVLASAWLVAAINGILFSYYAESPFIFIKIIHLKESQYGHLGIMIAVAALSGSLILKKLIHHVEANRLFFMGCVIILISSVLLVLSTFSQQINAHHKLIATLIIMLPMMGLIVGGFGFVLPITLNNALKNYHTVLGTAGALFSLLYYLLIALLTWIMTLIHNGTIFPMPYYFLLLTLSVMLVFLLGIKSS